MTLLLVLYPAFEPTCPCGYGSPPSRTEHNQRYQDSGRLCLSQSSKRSCLSPLSRHCLEAASCPTTYLIDLDTQRTKKLRWIWTRHGSMLSKDAPYLDEPDLAADDKNPIYAMPRFSRCISSPLRVQSTPRGSQLWVCICDSTLMTCPSKMRRVFEITPHERIYDLENPLEKQHLN